ncbi:uncharacterized protein LOC131955126 [Physella acuta]|uniref:uncharacterized protein LOC131955126 n=1 Tax=Physella acuta TaxID=109671 RepID=UPI0027DD670F|nr:uncharacterized protein LOC131955126 [Physella acuta]XP_059175084.1 uncharacterized protein LOC131955126 [Physella acuta]
MAYAGHASDDEAYDEDHVVQQNIREHKEHLVKKLRVFDLINGEHTFKNIIPHQILREIEARETIEEDRAARMFLDAFLESQDPTKYSVLRDALDDPEHAIVREILYTKNFDACNLINEAAHFDCHKKTFLENMESDDVWLSLCLEKELIFESDANRIRAHRTIDGPSRGNAMLLNAVQKSKDGLKRFLDVLWQMDRKECVKEIDKTIYQKMEAKDQDGWCTNEIDYVSNDCSDDNLTGNLSNWSEEYNIKTFHSKRMNDLTRDSNLSFEPIAHRTRSKTTTAAAILEHPQNTQLASAVNSPVMMAPPPTIPKSFGFGSHGNRGYEVNKEPSIERHEPRFEEWQPARSKSENYPVEKERQLPLQTSSDVKEKLGHKRENTSSPRDKHTCSCGHVCRDDIQLQVHSKSQVCRLNARATHEVPEHRQNDRGELGFQSSQTRGYNQTTLESTGVNTLKKELNSYQERSKNVSKELDNCHVDTLTNQVEKTSLQQSGARPIPQTLPGENSQTSTKQFRQSAERTVNSEQQFRQSAERTVNSEQQFRQSAERAVNSDESAPIVKCKLCNSKIFKENFEKHLEKCRGQSKSDEREHDRRRLFNRQTRSLDQPPHTPRDEDPRAMSEGPDNIGARPKLYRCQRCSKTYCSSAKLTEHQTSCTAKPNRQLNSTNRHGLPKHQSLEDRKMTAGVTVKCPHCQQKFPGEDDLRSHEARCSRMERTPTRQTQVDPPSSRPPVFRCPHCHIAFISKEDLDKHKSDQHRNK